MFEEQQRGQYHKKGMGKGESGSRCRSDRKPYVQGGELVLAVTAEEAEE